MKRLYAGALAFMLFLSAGIAFASSPTASHEPNDYADPATWLCLPDRDDACATDLATTLIQADGSTAIEHHVPDPAAPIDCFYVYPTVSIDPTPNADMNAGPEELAVIRAQFARFASQCRTFAPLYRQVTLTALRAAVAGQPMDVDPTLGYRDVVAAWNHYLEAHNDGRGVVLIGHSQGARMLSELLRNEIEDTPAADRIVSALIIGSNLHVPPDGDVGGSLAKTPLCRSADQTGCVINFVSFREDVPPPANSRFGRAAEAGMEAACTNPAALGGGRGELDAYLSAGATGIAAGSEGDAPGWLRSGEAITTPFVRVPGLLEAECVRSGDFHYLAVHTLGDAEGPRTHRIGGDVIGPTGAVAEDWGLHLIDMHLTMGNLLAIVARQADAWWE